MHASLAVLFTSLFSAQHALAAPARQSEASSAVPPSSTVRPAPEFPNPPLYEEWQTISVPQPIRGDGAGAAFLSLDTQNIPIERQSPDFIVAPSTDSGSIKNSKWSLSLSHNRVQIGGWARQQNENDMPIATALAGVNMRLKGNAYRELHWHSAGEWGYVFAGSARINAVDTNGKAYAAQVYSRDLWYFPPGIPHSIQGLTDVGDGVEFLLVFDTGTFSEDATFLVSDWLAHVPKEVISRNFGVPLVDLESIPGNQLWIFPGNEPEALQADLAIVKEAGEVPLPFSYAFNESDVMKKPGGTVRIVDSTKFKVSLTVAMAEVTVEPGAIRELHWHPTEPEWTFFLGGAARMTMYGAEGNARTYDYVAGDIAYVVPSYGHYIENIGNTTLHFLELFRAPKFEDMSLSQWLALTPPQIVKDTLNVGDNFVSHLSKVKQTIVAPSSPSS